MKVRDALEQLNNMNENDDILMDYWDVDSIKNVGNICNIDVSDEVATMVINRCEEFGRFPDAEGIRVYIEQAVEVSNKMKK